MDIKQKFRNFETKLKQTLPLRPLASSNQHPRVELTDEDLLSPGVGRSRDPGPDAEAARFPSDPHEDQQVLDEMETKYYDEGFDPSLYELKKLPATLDQNVINGDRQRLLKQLTVVTKRVFGQILEQRSACITELSRVAHIQGELDLATQTCQSGRRGLRSAKQEFTASSLGVLAAYRRRQQAIRLISDLTIIRTLQRTDERLQELLHEGNYPGAIQLLLECQKVVATYKHFTSIRQLSTKLQDTLEMTEEQLDVALSKVCVDFNADQYRQLTRAYGLLGKTQTSMDQLHMHLTSAIHNTAWNVVFGHAMLSSEEERSEADLAKKPYPELSACLATASILPCLVDLCRALWNIMASYKQIVAWHTSDEETKTDVESTLERQYVQKKLETGLMRIWQDVQTKVRVFVLANDLATFSIDDFIHFMDVIHKLIQVGHDFCGSKSDTLQESLKKQCWSYFHSYHLSRLEELRMHLEHEGWAICPVKPTFKVGHLMEFRHLQSSFQSSPTKSPVKKISRPNVSPFDPRADESFAEEDILLSHAGEDGFYSDESDEDVPDELKRDFVDENTGEPNEKPVRSSFRLRDCPVLTNTTLLVLRLCGKYLHLMQMLTPIAADVFTAMGQLLEFYTITVHAFFTKDLPDTEFHVVSTRLTAALRRIHDQLIRRVVPMKDVTPGSSPRIEPRMEGTVDMPDFTPTPSFGEPETLHGLTDRFVAVESAVFLANQLRALRPTVERLIGSDPESLAMVDKYYTQTTDVIEDLRRPIYMASCCRAVNTETLLNLMAKVSWDIKEVRSQHSHYVDVLLRELQVFSMRLQDLRHKINITSKIRQTLWELCIQTASMNLVEGFSSAKKCSNEGRALMQLDYRQFVMKIEKISELKPVPYQEYVSTYIKAYYIPELDLEDWVKQHTEYTPKQLVALVNCVAYNNNKTKQKLNSIISELSDRIRR